LELEVQEKEFPKKKSANCSTVSKVSFCQRYHQNHSLELKSAFYSRLILTALLAKQKWERQKGEFPKVVDVPRANYHAPDF
jgi:hypothetical protein